MNKNCQNCQFQNVDVDDEPCSQCSALRFGKRVGFTGGQEPTRWEGYEQPAVPPEGKSCSNCHFGDLHVDTPCRDCTDAVNPTHWKPKQTEPWTFSEVDAGERWLSCITEGHIVLAFDKEYLPDAKTLALILAAPKLLAALKAMLAARVDPMGLAAAHADTTARQAITATEAVCDLAVVLERAKR